MFVLVLSEAVLVLERSNSRTTTRTNRLDYLPNDY